MTVSIDGKYGDDKPWWTSLNSTAQHNKTKHNTAHIFVV